jgi:hypothetical protein
MNYKIYLYDTDTDCIGSGNLSSSYLQYHLETAAGQDVDVHISSAGGSAFDAIAIYDLLKKYPGNVTTYIDALALGLEDSKYVSQSSSKISTVASGTDTYTADLDPAITTYGETQKFYIRFTNANTSPDCTLSLNGLAALPLVKGIDTYLFPDDIVADSIHLVALDGTNARILSLSSIPTVTSGEKVLTITSTGPQKTYDLQELTVSSTSLTSADFSTGIAVVSGLVGQLSYDSNYRYDCIGINQWRRSALNGNLLDLYLADIDDTAGDKTSSDLETTYPSSLICQQAWGLNNLYIKKTTTGWKKIAIATA